MFDLSSLFISPAFAQTPSAAPQAGSGDVLMQFLPFFLILGVFYFLLIRPQQKKLQAQELMLKSLKKGDKIITSGGVLATVAKVESDDYLTVEIADGVRVKIVRATVSSLVTPPAPANEDTKKA